MQNYNLHPIYLHITIHKSAHPLTCFPSKTYIYPMQECPDDPTLPQDQSRRRFLRQAATGTAGLILLGSIQACTPPDPEIRIGTLDELQQQGHLSPLFNGDRIFTTQRDGQLITFSLICSHKRCTVKWKPDVHEFHCPCHQGHYDQQGRVISGPPPSPLRRFKTELRGQDIWVLNQTI